MSNTFTRSILRLLFIFTRSVRFVGRIQDTVESCLVFVLVSRRVSNLSNPRENPKRAAKCSHGIEIIPMDCTVSVYYR